MKKRIKGFAKKLLKNIILDPREINKDKKYARKNCTHSVSNK